MFKRTLIILTLISLLFILFACKDDIVIDKFCTEEPALPFTTVRLKLTTEITSERTVTVTKAGLVYGDNFQLKNGNVVKSANIGGYICSDMKFYIDVAYNDTINNSRLRIEGGPIAANFIPGKLYYCSNENNVCNYIQIGSINGSYSGSTGRGSFLSPLFSGEFEFSYVQQ